MSKVLAVFGATGRQGGSVANYVVGNPELSKEYKVRAVTRDASSEAAKKLAETMEVVAGDATDRASLEKALTGVHTVYAMTVPSFGADGYEVEYNSAKLIADVAVEQGAKYIIFSTLPAVKEISKGKYTTLTHFDAKAAAEQYIRGLPIKSAFISLGEFMENFHMFPFYAPKQGSDGTWVFSRANAPSAKTPLVAAGSDTGKFVGAILADPEKYEGKVVAAATRMYTHDEIASILSQSTGQKVVYKQSSLQEFRDSLPEFMSVIFSDALSYIQEFGYYGSVAEAEKSVGQAVDNAHSKVTTFDEYLRANPITLG